MYILDTDHLSVIDRGGATASNLLQRLATVDPQSVTTTIISYEEQMRGWMGYTAKAQTETHTRDRLKVITTENR